MGLGRGQGEMQYTDNVLLMMLEQEVSELREKEEWSDKLA